MHRLFVAIRPPAPIREQLLDLMEGVNGASWQDEDQLHLTLRFVGEVERHVADDIAAELATVRHPGFELRLNGIGSFERRGQAVTLWAGVLPHGPLKALHRKVDQAVQRAGVEPDHRAYLPHISLARLGRAAGPIATLLAAHGGVSSPPFRVDSFRLYESRLSPQGALYSVVERYRLD
ncbi:MAG TPA: RNA 2',3'-cyclic phosphodiesterase [Allosphingosinicella sp.]|nr:RNA 2',3'-cyclic phosphodiesterase [Allosphingosinicella sp.]